MRGVVGRIGQVPGDRAGQIGLRASRQSSRALAADGVDELLCGFMSRGRRLRSEIPRTLAVTVEADGRTDSWVCVVGPDGPRASSGAGVGPADCTVSGPVSDVYLALWNRGRLTDLDVTGDTELLALRTEKARVRWS